MLSHSLSKSLRKGRWKGSRGEKEGEEEGRRGQAKGRREGDRNRLNRKARKFLFINVKTLGTYLLTKLRVIAFVKKQVITNTLQSKKNTTVKPVWRRMVGIHPVLKGAPPNL